MSSMLIRNLSRFKLVTFDVTDTLMTFRNPPAVQYLETAKSFNITTITQDKITTAFKKNFKKFAHQYPNFGHNSSINCYEWWRQLVIQTLNDASTSPLDQHLVNAVACTLIEQYETPQCWTKFPKADELIQKVKEAGKHVGIISNFDDRLPHLLQNMNFEGIDFVMTSYETGAMKPDKAIFDKALHKCGKNVLPSEALHLGNEIELDYKGALDAGWAGVLIRNCDKNRTKESKVVCPMYDTIDEFLTRLETEELQL